MSIPMRIREVIYPGQDLCAGQGHPQAEWVCQVANNGAKHYAYRCSTCDRSVTVECWADRGARGVWVSAEFLKELGINPATVPVLMRELRWRRCQHCRKAALCEDHHWAPQAIFPDADQWPVGPLCADCHLTFTKTLEGYIQRRISAASIGRPRGAS